MNISYRFSPDGSKNDYALTVDGAEIGRVKDKEYAEAIEASELTIERLRKKIKVLTKENDDLTEIAHELRKRN